VDALGDEVEFLTSSACTGLDGDWDKVLSEIAGGGIDEEAVSIRVFDGDAG